MYTHTHTQTQTHTHTHIYVYTSVSIEKIDCILLWSFLLKAFLLYSAVKILCFSILNLYCVFDIIIITIIIIIIVIVIIMEANGWKNASIICTKMLSSLWCWYFLTVQDKGSC